MKVEELEERIRALERAMSRGKVLGRLAQIPWSFFGLWHLLKAVESVELILMHPVI